MRAKIEFCDVPPSVPDTAIVIKDVGHDKGFATITNDAEAVVETILRVARSAGEDPVKSRIFYYDSDGRLDELCHDGTVFTTFAPGPRI